MVIAIESSGLIEAIERFLEASRPAIKERLLKPIERKLEKAMMRAFALQRNAFLERFVQLKSLFESFVLREAILESDWMRLFTQAELETLRWFVGPIDEAVMASLLAGGQELMAVLGIAGSFSLTNPRAVTYLSQYGANLVKGVNETTRDYLRTVVTEGTQKGWSYNKTAKAITDRYQEFRIGQPQKHIDSRAHLIAVTESGQAYERGNMIVAEDLRDAGLEMEKSWLVTGGDICDLCLGNEAEGWIPIDLPFSSGIMQPLAHPACRCSTLYRRKGAED